MFVLRKRLAESGFENKIPKYNELKVFVEPGALVSRTGQTNSNISGAELITSIES
jgi:hypothetical protein